MDQERSDELGEAQRGGAANMPPFREPEAVRTAADHQITDGERTAAYEQEAEREIETVRDQEGGYTGRASRTSGRRQDAFTSAIHQFADRIDDASEALRGFGGEAEVTDDPRARITGPLHEAAERLDQVSGYLHERDAGELRRDVEAQIRARPLQAALLGLTTGWVLGKIIK